MDVDVVYTWVDGTDPAWTEEKNFYKNAWENQNKTGLISEPTGAATAASSETELYYSIKSVKKYMPWVKNIFIVSPKSHIPKKTFNEFPEIIVINQEEILPAHASLVTFNSHVIELALINIPNLSAHFIYMNDDFFINQPVSIEDFYRNESMSLFVDKFFGKVKLTSEFLMKTGIHRGVTTRARLHTNNVLSERYGPYTRHLLQHAPMFVIKDAYQECQRIFSKEVEFTYNNRFRHAEDIVPITHLYPYYMLHEKRAFFNQEITGLFVPITDYRWLNKFFCKKIKPEHYFFCLNDIRTKASKSSVKYMEKFLEKKFLLDVQRFIS